MPLDELALLKQENAVLRRQIEWLQHKLFGPGNRYVTAAKQFAAMMAGGPAIDMPAGPSELMIIADDAADARIVAADLLGQAEHDPAAQVLLVTDSQRLASQLARNAKVPQGALESSADNLKQREGL